MAQALELFFDDSAERAVRELWRRLDDRGVPSAGSRGGRPHVTLAVAGAIPASARRNLRSELELLSIPDLWLHTLGTFPGGDSALLLGAVVDTELLAVHSAVHDVLAGKVTAPSAYYFPGAWIPHCTLAQGLTAAQLAAGFAELAPPEAVRAPIAEVGVTDTRTGETEVLLTR
ncbi:2'-5' RNA ligase family protein [Saccharopolyspora taberi]|uniref:2'-5' RNA ligase family protein n=1 Tax=Saccharopolyspora taberi TaxID=60895 RepID=A0ABN3VCZ9_9PSEU